MKKLFLILALMLSVATGVKAQNDNAIVERISDEEILENRTPSAVAYNFVIAVLNDETDVIKDLVTSDLKRSFAVKANFKEFMNQFSDPNNEKTNIKSWLPLPAGSEVAVLYTQVSSDARKVYINVVPSRELGQAGFQDIDKMFDTNLKVIVVKDGGKWKVAGLK